MNNNLANHQTRYQFIKVIKAHQKSSATKLSVTYISFQLKNRLELSLEPP